MLTWKIEKKKRDSGNIWLTLFVPNVKILQYHEYGELLQVLFPNMCKFIPQMTIDQYSVNAIVEWKENIRVPFHFF